MATTYEPIATTTLSTTAANVDFTSISGSYTDLILIVDALLSSSNNSFGFRYNSDTGNNYSFTYLFGDGSAATSGRQSNVSIADAGYISGTRSTNIVHIQNYSNATTYKTHISRFSPSNLYAGTYVGLWRSTSAITSISIIPASSTFASGSTFTLYGIASA
jgi:hypothetical protein